MKADPSIFKAYDIRGIYPTSLNEDIAEKIGKAFARLITSENPGKKVNIALAKDMRLSSPDLAARVVEGLLKSGVNVTDIGLASTPTFYFGTAFYGFDAGIQVSASHNPPEFNGFKMVRAHGIPVSEDSGIFKMRDWVLEDKWTDKEPGTLENKSGVLEDLVKEQKRWIDWSKIKPYKIAVDTANGMGGLDVAAMFENTDCEIIKINFDLDGTFPVHQADPLKEENLAWVKKAVIEYKADLGIAVDGDADRYFFIDENGETVPQDILRGLVAQLMLKRYPGEKMGYDVRPGRATIDLIEAAGGIPVVNRVGHSLIKEQMLRENIVFSGEISGHYFFKQDYGTFEAPVILVGLLLDSLSRSGKKLSELWMPHKKYFNSGEINSDVNDKAKIIQIISEKYKDGKVSHFDGVSVEYPDYWFNVRPSNTENKLRLIIEARTKDVMEQKREEILTLIRS
jgi:phosphomannomutase